MFSHDISVCMYLHTPANTHTHIHAHTHTYTHTNCPQIVRFPSPSLPHTLTPVLALALALDLDLSLSRLLSQSLCCFLSIILAHTYTRTQAHHTHPLIYLYIQTRSLLHMSSLTCKHTISNSNTQNPK